MRTTCAFIVFGLVATTGCSDSRDTRAEREAQMTETYPSSQPAQNTPPPQIPTEPQTPENQMGTLSNGRGGSPNPSPVPPN
jgi:hypothetical protein